MVERTRLVVVASTLPIGGSERVLESLAMGLPSHGIDVDLLCLREAGEMGERIAERTGCDLRTNVAPARYSLSQFGQVAYALRTMAPDVLMVLDHANALLYAGVAARWAGVRATFTPIHSTRKPNGSPSLGRVDRRTVRLSQRVVALSPRHARYVNEQLGVPAERIVQIPNGVDTARFSPEVAAAEDLGAPAGGRARLGIVAALRPEKNHALLFETLASIDPKRRPELIVVGGGALEQSLRRRVHELGLDGDVRWLGARHDVPAVLRALDAVVLPSRDVVETFPVSVLEAMACEVPVIVSDVGAVRDMLDDGVEGLVVPPGDTGALADAIVALGADANRRDEMGRAGRRRVQRDFTLERMVGAYADLVHELRSRTGA